MFGSNNSSSGDTSVRDFVMGSILFIIGLVLIVKNVSVGMVWRNRILNTSLPSGVVLIPIVIGIVILLLNHRSKIGLGLIIIGVVLLAVVIMCSVRVIFQTTSLAKYFGMFVGLFGGGALLFKALLK